MLTADELRDARGLLRAAASESPLRIWRVRNALGYALRAYHCEAALPQPRLDCLTTAVRALAGALRERMEAPRG